MKSLATTLGDLQHLVEKLQHDVQEAETHLRNTRCAFQKEDELIGKRIKEQEDEMEELMAQISDQVVEIESYEDRVFQLGVEIENKAAEILDLQANADAYEDEISKELMQNDLEDVLMEVMKLKDLVAEGTPQLQIFVEAMKELTSSPNALAAKELEAKLKQQEIDIEHLESSSSITGMDLEATLGLSIEDEFTALRRRYNLTKGSDIEKEVRLS